MGGCRCKYCQLLGSDLLLTFDSIEKSTDEGMEKEAIEAEFYIP